MIRLRSHECPASRRRPLRRVSRGEEDEAAMTTRASWRGLDVVPRQRGAARVPSARRAMVVLAAKPMAHVPPQHVSIAPPERPMREVPTRNRSRQRRVRGYALNDLFAVFPDLPRPRRPLPIASRPALRRRLRRGRLPVVDRRKHLR